MTNKKDLMMPLEFEDTKPDDEIYQDKRVTVITKIEKKPQNTFIDVMDEEAIAHEIHIKEELRKKYKKEK